MGNGIPYYYYLLEADGVPPPLAWSGLAANFFGEATRFSSKNLKIENF